VPKSKMPGVLADTSVWIDFFRGTARVPADFERLIRTRQIATCGIVIAELVSGTRSPGEGEKIEAALVGLDYLEMKRTTWRLAGDMMAQLRRAGVTVPMSDVILAALAIQNDCRILTRDRHFRRIPKLRLSVVK